MAPEATTLLRGTRRPKCQGKGYIGRNPVFEWLMVDLEIEIAIALNGRVIHGGRISSSIGGSRSATAGC